MDKEKVKQIGDSLLSRILSDGTKESSKRFLSMYVVIVLGTMITMVSLYKGVDYVYLLGAWLAFAASLLGLSEYNKNRNKKHETSVEIEKVKAKSLSEPEVIDESEIN